MPNKRKPLYVQVKQFVTGKIDLGELAANERLPSEKELAEQFNVSRITVSNALNQLKGDGIVLRIPGKGTFVNPDYVSKSTEHPSEIKKNKTNRIGVILCHLESPFHLSLLSSLERSISDAGYVMLFAKSNSEIETECLLIDLMLENEIAGLIIYPANSNFYNERLVRMTFSNFPLILLDRTFPGINAVSVTSNNFEASYEGANFLLAKGHKNFAIINYCTCNNSIQHRVDGFKAALNEAGIDLPEENILEIETCWIPSPDNLHISSINMVMDFLKKNPAVTSLFALNSGIALIALKAAKNLNLRIPEDLEILTFDNPDAFHSIENMPVHYFDQKQGELLCPKAVDLLISQIKHEPACSFIGKSKLVPFEY